MRSIEKKLIIFFAVVLVLFYAVGFSIRSESSETCAKIGSCSSCWKTEAVNVSDSDLCFDPNGCMAEPEQQRTNAIVDTITCACAEAKKKDYTDTVLNTDIESAVRRATNGTVVTANQLCENPGLLLTRVAYG